MKKIKTKVSSRKRISDFCPHEWLKLEPYGLALGTLTTRPVFLLKNSAEDLILPVWLSTKAASDSLGRPEERFSVQGLYQKILGELGVQMNRAVFRELEGETQWVELYFRGSEVLTSLRAPAEQALPIALHRKLPLYATKQFVLDCRHLNAEIFSEFNSKDHLEVVTRNDHNYLM